MSGLLILDVWFLDMVPMSFAVGELQIERVY